MATITTDTFLDGGTARTAGEAWTINSGGSLTIRTDTRVHANAPAGNTGSLGSVTVTEGEVYWDSTNVRWLAYNSGSGNVPAIGTTVSQGGVSGYLLGVWATVASAVTAVGSAMPATGFIKFREVTGGAFSAGALTGIGATATGADVQGWISIVHDAAANLTFPRLGLHQVRGGRFFLDQTNGSRGQVFQVPSEGSTAMLAPGMFVETSPGSDAYEFWPALNGAANGWSYVHVGEATGTTDIRQKYLSALAGGSMKMGEAWSVAATYASLAAQAGTYAEVTQSCTYTWANNLVEVYFANGHQLVTGQQTGLDFTSGGATAYDGIYTVTVVDPYRFTVPLAGSGTAGNVTSKPGVTVTFAAHTLNIGDQVYCDFTSGTGVDGTYEVYMVPGTGSYTIKYPHVTALTAGNVSCLHTLVITYTAHGLAVGQTVYCDFTSGAGVDGVYVARVIAADTIRVTMPHSVTTSGNVTISRDIGYVAPSGCKTWIPSNILNEVATTDRTLNTIPNATIASRPEWTTTSAGAIDVEYIYGCSGYFNLSQPYSVRVRNCIFQDASIIQRCATALDVDGIHHGMSSNLNAYTLNVNNNYYGGTVKNAKVHRANTSANGHCLYVGSCYNVSFDTIDAALIGYTRNTGSIYFIANNRLTISNIRSISSSLAFSACVNCNLNNFDYVERLNGNGLAALPALPLTSSCSGITVDGVTIGFNGAVPNQHPLNFFNPTAGMNLKLRNIGSYNNPIPLPTWAPNLTLPGYVFSTGSSNANIKIQRVYLAGVRTAISSANNTDKSVLYESVYAGMYQWSTRGIQFQANAELNGVYKACQNVNSTIGQAAVYGTHWSDMFTGTNYGRLVLAFNEPVADTSYQFTMVSGTAKFNSSGGLLMGVIGNQCIWEMPYFAQGHTGFVNATPTMSGGTIGNYTLEFQYDIGSGYNGTWLTLSGANLSGVTIDPAIGFKLKIRITTSTTNTTAITYLRIDTTSTSTAQAAVSYPLDTNTLNINSMIAGSMVRVKKVSDGTVLYTGSASSITLDYAGDVNVTVRKGTGPPAYQEWVTVATLTAGATTSVTALQQLDE